MCDKRGTTYKAVSFLLYMAREFSKQFYNSKLWKETREYILMRDKYLCQHCNNPAEEVHHIVHLNPQNINDLNVCVNPNNLISLCKDCHFAEHYKDKGNGHKQSNDIDVKQTEYVFDENGYIVSPTHEKALKKALETVGQGFE